MNTWTAMIALWPACGHSKHPENSTRSGKWPRCRTCHISYMKKYRKRIKKSLSKGQK